MKIHVHIRKNDPPTGSHVFQATGTTFELVQNIIGTNLLTKFHDDRTMNMASRVLTRKNATPPWRPCFSTNRNHFRTHPRYHWDKSSEAILKNSFIWHNPTDPLKSAD
ncbi:hypothetical protein DPMN_011753 [Dreissena polymorpha]|uniref:Uncharacterized protein n=1 Tax=Dreissena polymorpha TaxID=45954 RepID=A0A9D4N5R0_DREPO|nr:hypothetical protein DPMN_011753 [Dreissena polymorpha]